MAYLFLKDSKNVQAHHEQALAIFEKIGDRGGVAKELGNLASLNSIIGQQNKAIELYQNALLISQEIGDSNREAKILGDLGISYLQLKQGERAVELFEKALAIIRQVGDRTKETNFLINLGTSNFFLGKRERALDYFNQALVICRETGKRSDEGMILKNMGQVYFAMKQVDKAIEMSQSAVRVFDELGHPGAASAHEQLKHFSVQSSQKPPYSIIVAIGLILIVIVAVFSGLKNRNRSSSTTTTTRNVIIEELYRNAPTNYADQAGWKQWENDYVGRYVRGRGRFDGVSIHPNEGKLFLIVTINGEDGGIENNTTQVALLVEDAYGISMGEKEGSFLVNDIRWIYMGEDYTFQGKVSGFSSFDQELVSAGYSDLVVLRGTLMDFSIVPTP